MGAIFQIVFYLLPQSLMQLCRGQITTFDGNFTKAITIFFWLCHCMPPFN